MSADTIPDDVMRAADAVLDEMCAETRGDLDPRTVAARAILAERQRCAKVAKGHINPLGLRSWDADDIAAAILNPPSAASSRAEQTGADVAPPASAPVANLTHEEAQ